MSELSTVAIKDGHRGHPHHLHPDPRVPFPGFFSSTTTQSHRARADTADAERADRISRLAGLERLSAARQSSSSSLPPGASANNPGGVGEERMIPPHYGPSGSLLGMSKERSTVGSASATTESVEGGTRSGYTYDAMTDKGSKVSQHEEEEEEDDVDGQMDEDHDMEMRDEMLERETTSSMGGMSDRGSLVGFGEQAGGSTISGPVSVMATQGSRYGTPVPPGSASGSMGMGGGVEIVGKGGEQD